MINAAYGESTALALIQRRSYKEAEQMLHKILEQQPWNAYSHSLLALALSGQKRHEEAEETAREAIRIAPESGYGYYALAWVLLYSDKPHTLESIEGTIREALRLEPTHSAYYELLSRLYIARQEWQTALDIAADGLRQNPRDVNCLNSRAKALMNLGRIEEADESLQQSLELEPENTFTHATRGWLFMQQHQPHEALNHFRESLRLRPDFEWAQEGIVEALKARNLVYRAILAYFQWLMRLNSNVRTILFVGAYIVFLIATINLEKQTAFLPVLVVIFYGLFFLFSWTARALFDLLLRFDPFGRLVLSPQHITASNAVVMCALVAAEIFVMSLPLPPVSRRIFQNAALQTLLMMVPVSSVYRVADFALRMLLVGVTFIMAGLIVTEIVARFFGIDFPPHGIFLSFLLVTVAMSSAMLETGHLR